MSNYSSDQTLDHLWNGPYRIDVADSCMGENVRILLDGRSAYLTPEDARLVAAALMNAAEATEEWAASWSESGQRVTHYPVDAAGEWMTAAGAHQGTRDDCTTRRPDYEAVLCDAHLAELNAPAPTQPSKGDNDG